MHTLGDADLVRAARDGSTPAQGELVRRHWRGAWLRAFAVTARAEAADDIAQEACITALARLGELAEPAAFGAWLARIATRRAIDTLRRERRLVELGEAPEPVVEWTGPAEDREQVRGAVAALAPDRRAAVVLRFWLDLTPSEIAEVLEVPVGTVNSRLARALAELRNALGESARA